MASRVYAVAALAIIALAMLAAVAFAKPSRHNGRVLQQRYVTATGHVQHWDSRSWSSKRTVYPHIYLHRLEIPQRYISGCRVRYATPTVLATVRALDCGEKRTRYRLRFVSIVGPERLRVRFTTGAADTLPGSLRY